MQPNINKTNNHTEYTHTKNNHIWRWKSRSWLALYVRHFPK